MQIDDEKERPNDRASQAGEILFWKRKVRFASKPIDRQTAVTGGKRTFR